MLRLSAVPPVLLRLISSDWSRPHWRILTFHKVDQQEAANLGDLLRFFLERFTFCSLSEGLAAITMQQPLLKPLMSVTFDDGDATVAGVALPILNKLSIRACVYVCTDYVARGSTYRAARPRAAMSLEQLRRWRDEGHEVGCHTDRHLNLKSCGAQVALRELTVGKDRLTEWLDVPIRHFAYPWGLHDSTTRSILVGAGLFASAATTDRGIMREGHDPFALRREMLEAAIPDRDAEALMRVWEGLDVVRRLTLPIRNPRGVLLRARASRGE